MIARLAASDRFLLGIATGKSRKGADFIVERHGWQGLFDTVQSADDAPSKPHPGMIMRAMAETGAAAERTAMVGDSSFDIEMAVAAGVVPVAVSWGFQPVERLVSLGARHVLREFPELPGALGLPKEVLRNRLFQYRMPLERALVRGRIRYRKDSPLVTFNGETLSVPEWSKRLGVKLSTLRERLRSRLPLERALHPGSLRQKGLRVGVSTP